MSFSVRRVAGWAGLILSWALLVSQTAEAAPVNAETAANAVRGWLSLDHHPMGRPLSTRILRTETVQGAGGAPLYHVVHLDPTGYVILPADDTVEPIIAFSATGKFEAASGDPVAVLVARDLPKRMAAAPQAKAHRKWQTLMAASLNPPSDSELNSNIVVASQVWVEPFVKTLWNQLSDVSEQDACYNYYTPPFGPGNIGNYPCGCVATCLAQLLRYLQYPAVGVGTNSYEITNSGVGLKANLRGGDGLGGPYQWTNMPLAPNSPTATQAQAVGALCYDAGVAVNMSYSATGSSAGVQTCQRALTNAFKLSSVGYDENDSTGLSASTLLTMIQPNLDARLPVSLGIDGPSGGHCVLVDGYGYSGSTLFDHINAGWSGDDDLWYALPDILTSDNFTFTIVDSCLYNIYTNGTGQIISGRVTDPSGAPVAGASITAARTGGGTYYATTDANGIYALVRIPASSHYTLTVANTGYGSASGVYSTGVSTYLTTNSGNVWGANFILSPPLLATPETGFCSVGPVGGPFSATSRTCTLSNSTASAISWSLANTAPWLNVTATNGSVAANATASLVISLNAAAGSMAAGNYSGTVFVTNLNNHLAQPLAFSLSIETADYPIAFTGFNADVVVESDAVGGNSTLYAQQFDPGNPLVETPTAFYETGLAAANLANNDAPAVSGLPVGGLFTSQADGATTFQLGPYTSNNVLYLTAGTNSGTLTLASPAAYASLSVLAASAQGEGDGSLALHFTDGTSSPSLAFMAPNYLLTNSIGEDEALTNFGIAVIGDYNEMYTVDYAYLPGYYTFIPGLCQSSLNLQSLGLHTKVISSMTFTMPSTSNTNMVTGVFALSGTASAFPMITAQPQSLTEGGGGNASFSVGVTGGAPLSYQWWLNGSSLPGAQSNALNLTGLSAANIGSYWVVVGNSSGAVTSSVAVLTVTNLPVSFLPGGGQFSGGKFIFQLTGLTGQGQVVVEASTNLAQWVPIFTNPAVNGNLSITDAAAGSFPRRYYRATTP